MYNKIIITGLLISFFLTSNKIEASKVTTVNNNAIFNISNLEKGNCYALCPDFPNCLIKPKSKDKLKITSIVVS